MWSPQRIAGYGVASAVLLLSACIADNPVDPAINGGFDAPTPSAVLIDGSTTGSGEFYFLPPLVNNPSIAGTFNPNLLPTMRVCLLAAGECVASDTTAYFSEGSAAAGSGQYQISWDTDGPETGPFDPDEFYRLEIAIGGQVMGSIDLDPQDPDGPGQSTAEGFYAFRVGETIPVKFWLSTQVLCTGSGYVVECIAGAVLDENGGTLALDEQGDRLSLFLPAGGLPGPDHPPITVVLERLDADAYELATGTECIPLFDAPQFGPCFRVTTYPQLTAPLDAPALISICIDPDALPIRVLEAQEDQLQIVRFATDGSGDIEALGNVDGDCPTEVASLLDVPEDGLFRYAALGLNAIARLVGPQPLAAHGNINLGGLTSSFSHFRFALPGDMDATVGDSTIIQDGASNVVPIEVQVLDAEGIPVEHAFVHFSTADGTITVADDSTDTNGIAYTTWTVDTGVPGDKYLNASARGLFDASVPSHAINYFFTNEAITVTATVVGPPAAIAPTPTGTISGTAGQSVGTVSITVTDAGNNPVAGAPVTWDPSGDGSVSGGSTTGGSGTASADWTLSTGSGGNTLAVTVGAQTYTFDATGAAGPAVAPTFSGDGQEAVAGSTVGVPLVVTSADTYGNPREGDVVTWTVVSGGGQLLAASGATDASGTATATWQLGTTVGENTVTVEVEGFTTTFTATGSVGPAVQPSGDGDGQTGTVGEDLTNPISITVLDANGNPREGDIVTWSGDGSFSAASPTDENGVAPVTWTLGTGAGPQTATATVGTGTGAYSVSFGATAEAGAPALISVSGDGQTASVGDALSNPLTVTITDTYLNPNIGVAVDWTESGGTISGATSTDGTGSASATWTLGALPGAYTATVDAGGLTHTFSATAECFVGYGIATIDGIFDAAEWACANGENFMANLSGGDTQASVHWMNDEENLYMAVRVSQTSFDRANSLLIDFDNDGDGAIVQNDDAIGYNADKGIFFDRYVTKKCLNSSQSGCGADDSSVDGDGTAANDETWTTYELSHPLNSGDAKDIAVAKDDMLGFFLTLRVGKGAQGNTQWPGFRNFLNITIVGF